AVDRADREALRRFRLQVLVAARDDRDLRIVLLEAGRYAELLAVRCHVAAAGIDQRGIEARKRAEQLADRRRAEAFGPRAAEREVVDHLPAETDLVVRRRAEVRVV